MIRFTVHVSRLAMPSIDFPHNPQTLYPRLSPDAAGQPGLFPGSSDFCGAGNVIALDSGFKLRFGQKPARPSEQIRGFCPGKRLCEAREGLSGGGLLEGQVSPSRGISNYATRRWRYCVPRNVPSPKGKPTLVFLLRITCMQTFLLQNAHVSCKGKGGGTRCQLVV